MTGLHIAIACTLVGTNISLDIAIAKAHRLLGASLAGLAIAMTAIGIAVTS